MQTVWLLIEQNQDCACPIVQVFQTEQAAETARGRWLERQDIHTLEDLHAENELGNSAFVQSVVIEQGI